MQHWSFMTKLGFGLVDYKCVVNLSGQYMTQLQGSSVNIMAK